MEPGFVVWGCRLGCGTVAPPGCSGATAGKLLQCQKQSERSEIVGGRYAQFRPQYPGGVVHWVAERLETAPVHSALPALDVGSGTGTFNRQFASALPAGMPVVGIEPSFGMGEQAMTQPDCPIPRRKQEPPVFRGQMHLPCVRNPG